METVSPEELALLSARPLLDQDEIVGPVVLVHLDGNDDDGVDIAESGVRGGDVGLDAGGRLVVGVASQPLSARARALAQRCDLTYVAEGGQRAARAEVAVPDLREATDRVREQMDRTPGAALTLAHLLRAAGALDGQRALLVESFAYSMLLAGSEYRAWLMTRERRGSPPPHDSDLVRLERSGGQLRVVLDHPARRNAYSARLRDELHDALRVALLDESVDSVVLSGEGPSFSAGGDLDEFGTSVDPVLAHVIRTSAGVATSLEAIRPRLEVRVQGPCVGAGVEIAAFAARVVARPDATFRLPEMLMGLLPGAGGTVSIARRIGRWRLLHLCLTGEQIDVRRALDWGLVDEVAV